MLQDFNRKIRQISSTLLTVWSISNDNCTVALQLSLVLKMKTKYREAFHKVYLLVCFSLFFRTDCHSAECTLCHTQMPVSAHRHNLDQINLSLYLILVLLKHLNNIFSQVTHNHQPLVNPITHIHTRQQKWVNNFKPCE